MPEGRKYTEEQKHAILRNLKEQRENNLILHRPSLIRLIKHLGTCIEREPCDHTFRYTREWIAQNAYSDSADEIIEDFEKNGMHCDCKILYNCYDKFSH